MTTSTTSGLAGSLSRQPWLLAAIVDVIAFLAGWILMGWVIWPVEWVDADVAWSLIPLALGSLGLLRGFDLVDSSWLFPAMLVAVGLSWLIERLLSMKSS